MKKLAATIKGFFFEHRDKKQIVLKNTFWMALADFSSRFFKFFLVIFAARILGATEYGKFSFAMAFATFFIVFADFGLDNIIVREFAKDKSQEQKFPAIFALRIFLSILMLLAILAGSFLITQDSTVRLAIWILGLYIFFQSVKTVLTAFFHALQRLEYNSLVKILEDGLLAGIGLLILFSFPSVSSLSLTYLFASFVGFILVFLLFKIKITAPRLSFDFATWKQFLAVSWPLGLAGFAGTIFNQVDSITLGLYKQVTQVGWYNAAYAIFGIASIPSIIIGSSFFPMLSQAFGRSREESQKIFNFQMETSFFFAFGFLAGGLALAPKIIDFFYDQSYMPSVLALKILLVGAAFFIMHLPLFSMLIVFNKQKTAFLIVLIASILNALLDILLIPHFSLYGPAFATSVSTLIMAFTAAFFISETIPLGTKFLLCMLIGAGFSGGITYVILSLPQLAGLYVLPAVVIGGLLYLSLFLSWRWAAGRLFTLNS